MRTDSIKLVALSVWRIAREFPGETLALQLAAARGVNKVPHSGFYVSAVGEDSLLVKDPATSEEWAFTREKLEAMLGDEG